MPTLPCISTSKQPLAATRSHSSGRKWLQVAAPSEWPQVAAASGRKWLLQPAPSEWPQVGASGREWPQVAAPSERPQVAASGRSQRVAASGRKWPQVAAFGDFNFHTQSNPPEFYSHKGALAEIEGSGFPGSSPKLWLLHFWALNCGSKGGPVSET